MDAFFFQTSPRGSLMIPTSYVSVFQILPTWKFALTWSSNRVRTWKCPLKSLTRCACFMPSKYSNLLKHTMMLCRVWFFAQLSETKDWIFRQWSIILAGRHDLHIRPCSLFDPLSLRQENPANLQPVLPPLVATRHFTLCRPASSPSSSRYI